MIPPIRVESKKGESMSTSAVVPQKHGFFHAIAAFFEKLGHSNSWEKSVSTTIAIAAPLTEDIVALTAGEADAAKVQSAIVEVQNDLALVKGVVDGAQAGTAPASLIATATASLESVKTNLGALLTAGHIKDPATLEKVTLTVNTIIGEVVAMLGAVPVAKA
jgi:hypothetical protein